MVQINYKGVTEEADLAGKTLTEVRGRLKEDFGIPYLARVRLNGRPVEKTAERRTILQADDCVSFTTGSRHRGLIMAAGLLAALVITGGSFAYGFIANNTVLEVTQAGADFVTVTANTSSSPQWTAFGQMRAGSTGAGTLFDIDTATANYTGDIVVTVTMANVAEMTEAYRYLALSLEIRDSGDNLIDINADGDANTDDFALLTLNNAVVDMNIAQGGADVYTLKLRNGTYRSNEAIGGWSGGASVPVLYCEVSQK